MVNGGEQALGRGFRIDGTFTGRFLVDLVCFIWQLSVRDRSNEALIVILWALKVRQSEVGRLEGAEIEGEEGGGGRVERRILWWRDASFSW